MRRDSSPLVPFLAGAAIGAGLMFLLDPDRGTRRRALGRDQVLSAGRRAGDQLGAKARHIGNRARGLAASARTRDRVQGVAGTVAALAGREHALADDVAEALAYRLELSR